MVQSFPTNGRKHYGPDSSRQRHNDRGSPSSVKDEAAIIALRKHTLLPFDDCPYTLQTTIPHLTRPSLHCCPQRYGISRLPTLKGDKPTKKRFKSRPIGYFHVDIAQVLPTNSPASSGHPSLRGSRWIRTIYYGISGLAYCLSRYL